MKTSNPSARFLPPTALSRLAGAMCLGAILLSTGCGHGAYTSAHKSAAAKRIGELKSAGEWEMAKQAFLAGDLQKALNGINRSLLISPEVAKSHVLRGRILLEMGELEAAIASFEQAEKFDALSDESHYYRGIIFERIKRYDRAVTHHTKAAEIDKTNPQYVVAAAEVMIDQGRIDEAESYLHERRDTFEHNAGVRQTLGHIRMMKNDPAAAVEYFGEARLLAPDDLGILEDLVRAQIQTGRFAEAEYNLSRLLSVEANKGRRDLLHMRAQCLVKVDRLVDAREIYLELTQGNAGNADAQAWIGLGNVSFMLRDYNRVRNAASRVIAIAPQQPEGHLLRGLVDRQAGNFKAAAQSFARALELRNDVNTAILLGLSQQDSDDFAAARATFASIVASDPENETARRLLAGVTRGAIAGAEEKR